MDSGALRWEVALRPCEKARRVYKGAGSECKNEPLVSNLLLFSKLKVVAAVLVLLSVGSSVYGQTSRSSRLPPFFPGTWEIYRFVEVGGHGAETKERAEAQIGKKLKISAQSFEHDPNFLWLGSTPCKGVRYRMTEDDADNAGKGSLDFYGLESAETGRVEFISVTCDKERVCSLELAKNQELAVYLDGWFFFLRKTGPKSTQ